MTLQGFTIDVYDVGDDPILELTEEDTNWIYQEDYGLIHYSASGDITGSMVAIDVETPPTGPANSTNSGCQTNDFDAFPAGSIAIISVVGTFQEKPPTLKTLVPVPWSYSTRGKMDGKVYLMEP